MTSSPEASSTLWREWHLDTEKKPGFLKKQKKVHMIKPQSALVCYDFYFMIIKLNLDIQQ